MTEGEAARDERADRSLTPVRESPILGPSPDSESTPLHDADATQPPLPARGAIHPAVYISIWILGSCAVILFNKYLLSYADFPFPIFLTAWHMVFATAATQLLVRTTSLIKDVGKVDIDKKMFCKTVVPIGACFSAALILYNQAYLHLSVAFIQMLKATTPAAVLLVGWLLRTQTPTTSTIWKILIIIIGTIVASYGELEFVMIGFTFQVTGILCEAARLVLVQKLLQDFKMDPLCSLYYFAPVCAMFNGIAFIVFELPRVTLQDFQNVGVLLLVANGACAFALNVAVVFLIGKTSPLVMCLAGIFKDILLVAFSVMVWQTSIGPVQLCGYGIALFGLFWYKNGSLSFSAAEGKSTMLGPKRRFVLFLVALVVVAAGSVLHLSTTDRYDMDRRPGQLSAIKGNLEKFNVVTSGVQPPDVSHGFSKEFLAYRQPLEEWYEVVYGPTFSTEPLQLPVPYGKYHVWTVNWQTGGPEALLQLYIALRNGGHDVYHSGFNEYQQSVYEKEGLLSKADSKDRYYPRETAYPTEEGWTIIIPEVFDCPPVNATCFVWLLANRPFSRRKVSHAYYISEKQDVGFLATFQPYMSPLIWKYADLGKPRSNLVIVDNDANIPLDALEPLRTDFPDLEIKVAVDMPQSKLYEYMSIAKVVVDANMVGMERIIFEGRIAGAVPICGRQLVGSHRWDLAFVPKEHVFATDDQLRDAVRSALQCYECEVAKTVGQMETELKRREVFERMVLEATVSNAKFVIPYCGGRHEEPLLTAVSVLLSMPFSSVDIALAVGQRAEFMRERKPYWDVVAEAGLTEAITVTESADVSHRGTNSTFAAFRCMSGSAMDAYVNQDIRRFHRRTHTVFVGADTVLPREDFQAEVIGRFIRQKVEIPCKFGTVRVGKNLTAVVAHPPAKDEFETMRVGTNLTAVVADSPAKYERCYETIAWENRMREYIFQVSELDTVQVEVVHRILGNLCVYPLWSKIAAISTTHPRLHSVCSRYFENA